MAVFHRCDFCGAEIAEVYVVRVLVGGAMVARSNASEVCEKCLLKGATMKVGRFPGRIITKLYPVTEDE